MSASTKIEWTRGDDGSAGATWNPVTGCTKVSSGCDHCYAETFAERWRGVVGHPFEQGSDVRLWPDRLSLPLRRKKPTKIGGEKPSEIVRGEAHVGEFRVRGHQGRGGAPDDVADSRDRQSPRGAALEPLEQVGKRLAPGPFLLVIPQADRNGPVTGDMAADDLRDDVEEFGRHGDDPLAVALGRADHQQGDDLAVRPLVLANAQVRELGQFLPPQPREPQRFDDGPFPEGVVLFVGQAQQVAGVPVDHCSHRGPGSNYWAARPWLPTGRQPARWRIWH